MSSRKSAQSRTLPNVMRTEPLRCWSSMADSSIRISFFPDIVAFRCPQSPVEKPALNHSENSHRPPGPRRLATVAPTCLNLSRQLQHPYFIPQFVDQLLGKFCRAALQELCLFGLLRDVRSEERRV